MNAQVGSRVEIFRSSKFDKANRSGFMMFLSFALSGVDQKEDCAVEKRSVLLRISPWLAGAAMLVLATGGPVAVEETAQTGLVGKVLGQGDVWVGKGGEGIDPAAAGQQVSKGGLPLTEGSVVRTGDKSAALLDLGNDGMIGLREGSRAIIGKKGDGGLRVEMVTGEALVRLSESSKLTLVTSKGTVHQADGEVTGPTELRLQALPNGGAVAQVTNGTARVEDDKGAVKLVSGAPIMIPEEEPPPAYVPPPAPEEGGFWAFDPLILGLAALAIAGGTVGGLAASGQFDDDDDGGSDSGGGFNPPPFSQFRVQR